MSRTSAENVEETSSEPSIESNSREGSTENSPENAIEEGSNSMEDDEKAAKMEAIRCRIPKEPTEGEIVRLRIVYPDGTKLQRNFLASDRFGFVLDLIDLDVFDHNLGFPEFRLCMTIPRKELDRVGMRGGRDS